MPLHRSAAVLALLAACHPVEIPLSSSTSSTGEEDTGEASTSDASTTGEDRTTGEPSTTSDPSPSTSTGATTGGATTGDLLTSTGDDPSTSTGAPLLCGNGVQDEGEECDDGNLLDADFCTASCTLAVCGDGVVQLGVEACDDGNDDDTDACPGTCKPATCGDGFTWAGEEECDDGNAIAMDGCEDSCTTTPPFCGDGALDEGEGCDDGNMIVGDGCDPDCTPSLYELDGFAQDVPLATLKGWTLCYDRKLAPFNGWTWTTLKEACFQDQLASQILIGCMFNENMTDVADVVAAGPMPEAWQVASEPAKPAGAAWWLYDPNPEPQKNYFGAIDSADPQAAVFQVLFAWKNWEPEPKYPVSGPCGDDLQAADSWRRVVYLR